MLERLGVAEARQSAVGIRHSATRKDEDNELTSQAGNPIASLASERPTAVADCDPGEPEPAAERSSQLQTKTESVP